MIARKYADNPRRDERQKLANAGMWFGQSEPMLAIKHLVEKVAPSELPCLIEGETGTGKDTLALHIHHSSPRSNKPFVVLDCASIPEHLIESYLFGHERGAFAGATRRYIGAVEHAQGGTLFLDGVSDLSLELQPKLLRLLDHKSYWRVGGSQPHRLDCRIIASTTVSLRSEVEKRRFREDLYYRLATVHLKLPSLRERRQDIPDLVGLLLDDLCAGSGVDGPSRISPDVSKVFSNANWQGNLRELKNVLSAAWTVSSGDEIQIRDLEQTGWLKRDEDADVMAVLGGVVWPEAEVTLQEPLLQGRRRVAERYERQYVFEIMCEVGGDIGKAARLAGISRPRMRALVEKYEVSTL